MSAFTNEIIGDVTVNNFPATQVVSGSVAVSNFPATQPVSGTVTVANPGLTDSQLRATPVPVSGSISTTPVVASTATVSQLTSNGSNQTLLAANASRKRAILFFSSGIWNVKFGAVASGTSRTLQVNASNYFLEIPTYVGQIDAICTTSGKLVDITELV